MSILTTVSRRSFLRSSSALLALPYLHSFADAKASPDKVKRMIFLGQGYGFVNDTFYPTKSGKFSEMGLTEGMSSLKKHRDDITLLGNLVNKGATNPHNGSTTFLTGAAYTNPRDIKNTISCDQLAAEYLCNDTRYSHLTLTTAEDKSGHGSLARSLAWDRKGNPVSGLNSSMELYNKLFSVNESKVEVMRRIQKERSVLDTMKLNVKSVSANIAKTDKSKLEEYFQSIRELEKSLKKQVDWVNIPKPKAPFEHPKKIDGEAEVKLMFDMIALAFQTDQTRIATYMMPSQSVLSSMGVVMPVHALSHYSISAERKVVARERDKKCTELLGYLLDKLKARKDINGKSLYENSIVSYGTNIRSGHGIEGLPLILSGGGIKNLRLGENIMLPKDTPLQNVWLTLLQETGVPIEKFSSSTRPLSQLLS